MYENAIRLLPFLDFLFETGSSSVIWLVSMLLPAASCQSNKTRLKVQTNDKQYFTQKFYPWPPYQKYNDLYRI